MRLEMKGAAKERQQPETTMRIEKTEDRGRSREPPETERRRVDHAADWAHNLLEGRE